MEVRPRSYGGIMQLLCNDGKQDYIWGQDKKDVDKTRSKRSRRKRILHTHKKKIPTDF